MANFNRDNRGGGKFGKRNFGGRDARPQMHDAVCDNCGKRCQVPFRPTGERPIYCSDCFERERGPAPERAGGRERRMYSAVCSNCGKKCEVPFLPTGGSPTYCKDCFDKGLTTTTDDRSHTERKNTDSYRGQFEALNAKLDKILNMLAAGEEAKKPAKKAPAPKKAKKK